MKTVDLWGTLEVNDKGHLQIGGCDTVDLVRKYGTPLYVMDEAHIRNTCRKYKNTIAQEYGDGLVLFASKAFLTTAMCKIIHQEGLGLDAVSGGELYTAIKASFPMEKVYFHGNNKTLDELEMAIEAGIACIVVDNMSELMLIEECAQKFHRQISVSIRVKPGIEAHTHHYIQTGQIDSKFGLGIESGEAMTAIRAVLRSSFLRLKGIHCHIGSQIFDVQPYRIAVDVMTDFIVQVKKETGFEIPEINFGGGFGIRYIREDSPQDPRVYVRAILDELKIQCKKKRIKRPFFIIEPGRSIVGEAGTTLYTVGYIKNIPGIRKYVSVDGGMTDNPRPALYQAKYRAIIANKANRHGEEIVSIAGKCCESGDMLIWEIELPRVERNDILAVFATGAYNYSMASNYNKTPIPAVVLVKDGKSDLMVRRQTYEDLLRNDCIPSWLQDK